MTLQFLNLLRGSGGLTTKIKFISFMMELESFALKIQLNGFGLDAHILEQV